MYHPAVSQSIIAATTTTSVLLGHSNISCSNVAAALNTGNAASGGCSGVTTTAQLTVANADSGAPRHYLPHNVYVSHVGGPSSVPGNANVCIVNASSNCLGGQPNNFSPLDIACPQPRQVVSMGMPIGHAVDIKLKQLNSTLTHRF